MTRPGIKAAGALILACVMCAASPALADHGDEHHGHGHGHWHHHHEYHEHHGHWHHDYDDGYVRYYGYGPGYYGPGYYYGPRYYGPQVYVPAPAPPSFGLNLVFPIH